MSFKGGYFENPIHGYSLTKIPHSDKYIFTLHPTKPLTYVTPNDDRYQPDKHLETDMASVPRILQWLPGLDKDDHLLPAIYHDNAYKLHYIWKNGHKYHMTRKEADDMLRDMIQSEGGAISSWIYWVGVRIGGKWSW